MVEWFVMRGWGERSYVDGVKVGTKLGSTSTAAANHNQGHYFTPSFQYSRQSFLHDELCPYSGLDM